MIPLQSLIRPCRTARLTLLLAELSLPSWGRGGGQTGWLTLTLPGPHPCTTTSSETWPSTQLVRPSHSVLTGWNGFSSRKKHDLRHYMLLISNGNLRVCNNWSEKDSKKKVMFSWIKQIKASHLIQISSILFTLGALNSQLNWSHNKGVTGQGSLCPGSEAKRKGCFLHGLLSNQLFFNKKGGRWFALIKENKVREKDKVKKMLRTLTLLEVIAYLLMVKNIKFSWIEKRAFIRLLWVCSWWFCATIKTLPRQQPYAVKGRQIWDLKLKTGDSNSHRSFILISETQLISVCPRSAPVQTKHWAV